MELENMRGQLARLTGLVEGWTGEIPAIERDLALEYLRTLYDTLKNVILNERSEPDQRKSEGRDCLQALPSDEEEAKRSAGKDLIQNSKFKIQNSPEVSIVLDDLLTAPGAACHPEASVSESRDLSPEPEPAPEPAPARLFDTDDLVTRHREKRRVIMSLYDSDIPAPFSGSTPLPEPPASAEPEQEAPETSEESIMPEEPTPIQNSTFNIQHSPAERITGLRTAIGLNDKYLILSDLFGGDEKAYDETIDRLDAFDNLEDCLIHIAEHYDWNPASEGAKLLIELLERKLL